MREAIKDADALEHLKDLHGLDYSFYFAYEVDENNKLTHVLWANGLIGKAHSQLQDVIVFLHNI